jgi:alanine-glyoxylate transaminase / (R)-3-amino-2-methylpropionate-pyruvate transaminase
MHNPFVDAGTPSLADFVSQGWDRHAEAARDVVGGLQARAATLVADGDAAGAIGLAEHVWLSHLNEPSGLEAFVRSLPDALATTEPTAAALQRTHWVLALLSGRTPPPTADALRWRGMQGLWAVWAATGRAAQAAAMLRHEAPQALAHPEAAARRALAATCNNLATDLQEGPRGDAAVDALMMQAATDAARLWRSAGTWVHAERAEYRLARCHAVLGQGDEALRHAQACLAGIDAHADQPEADAFERFFAHEALAWAHRARGDAAAVASQRACMQALRDQVTDEGLQQWCDQTLASLAGPPTTGASHDDPLPIDWSTDAIVARRDRYYAASQRAFVPYRTPLIFSRGEGQYLWDETGRKYIDLLGMNVCVSVGHAHPVVTAAVREQIEQLAHCTTMFYHPVPAHYAEELVARLPAGADWVVHFTSSGAEAVDLALVMAQTFSGHIDMLALRNAYHGATLGAQSLTGIAGFRHEVPLLGGIHHIANPDPYRGIFGDDTAAYLAEIDRTVQYATSGTLAGLIVETIQGYGGIVELPAGYLKAATEKVRARGGVLIADEVQSGFGRTGDSFWAFEAHDVLPEIVVLAKGMGNGYPLGAVVAQRHVAESLSKKFFFNTYGANPMSCAAGRAVLQVIDDEKLQHNAEGGGRGAAGRAARPAVASSHHRRRARARPDAGHRTGERPPQQGPGHRRDGRDLREDARARAGGQQVGRAQEHPAHGAADVPDAGRRRPGGHALDACLQGY